MTDRDPRQYVLDLLQGPLKEMAERVSHEAAGQPAHVIKRIVQAETERILHMTADFIEADEASGIPREIRLAAAKALRPDPPRGAA